MPPKRQSTAVTAQLQPSVAEAFRVVRKRPRAKVNNDKTVEEEEEAAEPKKRRRQVNRFNGMSEEEVAKRGLPDYLKEGLDVVFIGINPSLAAAYTGNL